MRFYDVRTSTLPQDIGLCVGDSPGLAQRVNAAENRLIMCREAGDEGWYGTWAEMAFTISQASPYLTLPRNVARIEAANLKNHYIPIQNQFYEYLTFGNGRLPKTCGSCRGLPMVAAYSRNNVPTFIDITNPPQLITITANDTSDAQGSRRVLIQGLDANGNTVYSLNGSQNIQGIFLTITSPFVTTPFPFSQITGIQKDITNGTVTFMQMDPTTGAQTPLHTMEPGEQSAAYRRYYFDALPNCCFSSSATPLTVTAICKLDPIPVITDSDYLNLQGSAVVEAIIDECQAIRYSKMDSPSAKQMAAERHQSAVRILNGILTQYLGKEDPAVNFKPFGSASLARLGVGMT